MTLLQTFLVMAQNESKPINSIDPAIIAAFINGCFAVFNIISGSIFSFLNYRFLKRNKLGKDRLEIYSKWYLPLKLKFSEIACTLNSFEEAPSDVLFSVIDMPLHKRDREDIKHLYQSVIEFANKTQYYFLDTEIDKAIFDAIKHIQFILINFNNGHVLSEGMRNYPLPDYQNLIKMIDHDIEKHINSIHK